MVEGPPLEGVSLAFWGQTQWRTAALLSRKSLALGWRGGSRPSCMPAYRSKGGADDANTQNHVPYGE